MMEIKGKVNTALCFAKVIEDEAIEQIRRMCDYEFTAGSRIRIMPDVHAGKGCTIGTTMTVTDKAVPNIVGVDIGCGMYTVSLGTVEIDMEQMDAAAHYIPSGMDVWEGRQERFDLTELRCYRSLKDAKRLERSLGTLGGGNHFIEIDQAASIWSSTPAPAILESRWRNTTSASPLTSTKAKRNISQSATRSLPNTKPQADAGRSRAR